MAPLSDPAPGGGGGGALVFVGFMGAGKSTAARRVAAELGVAAADSDRVIEERIGEPIEGWFDREGERAFRALEEEVVLGLLADPDARVIALGGGALASEPVRAALAEHTVVHVEVSAEEDTARVVVSDTGVGVSPERLAHLFDVFTQERRSLARSGDSVGS